MKNRNAYDLIADEVFDYRDIQRSMNVPDDLFYIVDFRMSYKPFTDYERCTEIVELQDDEITFEMDFCEGQKYVCDVRVRGLSEIGEIMRRDDI